MGEDEVLVPKPSVCLLTHIQLQKHFKATRSPLGVQTELASYFT